MADTSPKYAQPDQAASDEVKNTMNYGSSVANYIANEWFFNNSGVARFYDTREEFERLRLYARGAQSTAKYKRELAVDGDLSFLNLDWEPVPIIPKFVDLVVNKNQDRLFDVKAQAQDSLSVTKRKEDIKVLRGEMRNKQELLAIQEATGVDVFENDPASLPQSDDELQVYTQLNYKQNAEIAAETTINHILDSNDYYDTRKRFNRDLTEIGLAVGKHSFCPQKGVKVDYVDPTDFIFSYSEDPSFKDCYYFAEIKRITVADLKQMFPHLTEEDLTKVRQAGAHYYDYHGISYDQVQSEDDESRESNKVEVMFFCWKSTRNSVYKVRENRKGGMKAVKRDDTFEGPKTDDAKFERVKQQEEVVYEGVQVLGNDDLLLKWELQKNMIRPKSSSMSVIMPYVVHAPNFYKGRFDSIVKRITKYADMYMLTYLKIQQVTQKVVPPGLYINVDGLAEIDMGDGSFYNPREALNMFFQTGSIIGRGVTQDGDPNSGSVPIQELPGSQMLQLQGLINAQQYYLEQMRLVTGINEAVDAAAVDPRAAVGIQKQQAANSSVATRHILDANVSITRRICDAVINRMQDIFEYHPLKENFINAVGKRNAFVIDHLDKLHLRDFGIFIELEPDDEEKQYLEQNIQQALAKDLIFLDDAIDVRSIKNLKLANQVLKVRRKRKFEEDQAAQAQQAQQASEGNAASAQAAEEAKQKTEQMKAEATIQADTNKSQLKIQELEAEMQFELEILAMKHQYELELMRGTQSFESSEGEKDRSTEGGAKPTTSIGTSSKQNTVDKRIKGRGLLGT